jgi:phytoene/squalene synthetase
MTENSNLEVEYCRELALLPGSVFEFTSRFVPEPQMEPLLPLYALKQAIGGIPQSQTDDSVKWAKLKWWSEELCADPGSSARHPVLRALWLSGARLCLDDSLLLRLVRDALLQIDTVPDSDEQAMFERLSELGDTDIQLELALNKAEIDVQCLKSLAAASRCYGFISSFSSGQLSEASRIPLSLLAQHSVSSTQLEQGQGTNELTQIISRLTENAAGWFDEGMSGLSKNVTPTAGKHLRLRWAMEKRHLGSIGQDVPGFLARGKRFGPSDAWFAWRFVRKAG